MTPEARAERAMLAALVHGLENDRQAENVLRIAMPFFVRAIRDAINATHIRSDKGAERVCPLIPDGYSLYRVPNNVGGHLYLSDEIGGAVAVWDTSVVYAHTLMSAVVEEERRRHAELNRDAARQG